MSITDRKAATLYQAAQDETRPRPPQIIKAFKAADLTWKDMNRRAYDRGIDIPNDDRAENMVHAIFRHLVEAQGLDVDALADMVDLIDL